MKKSLLLCSICLMYIGQIFAQDRTIRGKVMDATDSTPIPGVSVTVKGTTKGTTTDAYGMYQLSLPAESKTLVFSFIGFVPLEETIGSRSMIDVQLKSDVSSLEEVVITALNISRSKKSLGYAVQEISGDKLTAARDNNVANALAGKIAGVQVLGQSGAKFGTPNIRVRGVNTLTGGNPLYVVDGTPVSGIEDVNMDDVENLSVLKGASATALYGNRASGGVIVITTKRAKSGETSFTINHSTTMDMVGLLPEYQNEYGGGYEQEWKTFKYNAVAHPIEWQAFDGHKILDYSADESWGPKLDGTLHRSAFSWQPGSEFGQLTPFEASPNNIRDFFNKPFSHNTNIAFAKGGDNYQTRISYTHIVTNGIVPNSKQNKDYVSAKNTFQFSKQLSAVLDINYTRTQANNVPADNYGSANANSTLGFNNSTISGFNQTSNSFNQWFQRQIKIEDLKNYKNPDGTYRSWNIGGPTDPTPKYWDSPYTQLYENTNSLLSNRIYGSFGLTYKLTSYLTISATLRKDFRHYYGDGRIASGTHNAGGKGSYGNVNLGYNEENYETLLSFNKTVGTFSIIANAGTNVRKNNSRLDLQSTVGGLTTPGFYSIAASKDRPTLVTNSFTRQVNSVFGNVSLGYRDMIYLEGSIRNDWSSTLHKANNSYLYPSVSGSFVFSELISPNKIFTFGKLRLGYAQVGTDTGPYNILLTYNVGNPYGTNPTMSLPSVLPTPTLKPGFTKAYEAGLDLKFLNNRVNADFTVYRNNNSNQIIPLPVTPTSGYNNARINAGLIQTEGFEVHIGATPIQTAKMTWTTDLNFDRSTSTIVELAPGLTNYQLDTRGFGTTPPITINAREGEEWGLLVGRKIRTNAEGQNLIGDDGHYLYDDNQPIGSVLPKFKGGWQNTVTYKHFTFKVNADFIVGGKFFSITRMFNASSGLAAETAGLNELGNPKRDPVSTGGGILLEGVTKDGTPNTKRVDTKDLYGDKLSSLYGNWVYDQTFIKIREISLGYKIPSSFLNRLKIKTANVAFIVRNPLLVYSAIGGGIDISEAEVYWNEGGQLPPVRSFGVNVNLGF